MADDAWLPTLEDYIDLAALLLGTTPEAVRRLPRLHLAESAVHAPFAAFGGEPAYPELLQRAAVLIMHLAQNHPLPDGNKRTAFLLTTLYLERNGRRWLPEDVEADAGMVERIAAGSVSDDDVRRCSSRSLASLCLVRLEVVVSLEIQRLRDEHLEHRSLDRIG